VLQLHEGGLVGFVVAACATIAIIEASLRLLAQRDLKRIVALTTVIEMNWVGVCVGLGGELLSQVGSLVLVAHSFTTTAEFFIVECVYRRYQTRDVFKISGLAQRSPLFFALLLVNLGTTIGVPGTSLFTCKLLFLAALAQYSLTLFCLFSLLFILGLPLIFVRI
jgi:formate hydrogenlyase subunit 3/multisubunit Na+/H+ antiporter MnhD subunit